MEPAMVKYDSREIRKVMKKTFGYTDFKSCTQKKAVEAVLSGAKNILVSMPTTGGKSLCYQLPALMRSESKVVLVISPTLSLIKNQTDFLKKHCVDFETYISSTRYDDRDALRDELMEGTVKFLFITPEMCIQIKIFLQNLLSADKVLYVVIDEAHCVVDSFREDAFLELADLRSINENIPFIALTSVATDDASLIAEKLAMDKDLVVVRSSSQRENIFYDVVPLEIPLDMKLNDYAFDLKDFLKLMQNLAQSFGMPPGEIPCGIIYCQLIGNVDKVCSKLNGLDRGTVATPYHGGFDRDVRDANYTKWLNDEVPVIVATTESFGFGIIKDFVGFVIHAGAPKNIRAFYQESGRCGADGKMAHSRIYFLKKPKYWEALEGFLTTKVCRRQFLGAKFGDSVKPCRTACDNCVEGK